MKHPLAAVCLAACVAASACAGGTDITTTPETEPPTTTAAPGTTTGATGPTTTASPDAVGSPGIGDPYYPRLGNGGFDIEHYRIETTVDPDTGEIVVGRTTISATAEMDLEAFYLDFTGLEVTALAVDGLPAGFTRDGEDLLITPVARIGGGEGFTVEVRYRGTPEGILIPSVGVDAGWTITPDEVYVAAEPNAAHTWFPGNDHPSDKAAFTIITTVPEPFVVASNGTLIEERHEGGMATFVWETTDQMATYLATIAIGEYERVESPPAGDVVRRDYLPADLAERFPTPFERTAEWIGVLEEWFGPYPFSAYGHVVVSGFPAALETQTMTVMGRAAVSDVVVVHEIAHQWYGDSVSPATWQDIWLNEGFATFAEFLWIEDQLGTAAMESDIAERHRFIIAFPHRAIADPGRSELFGHGVYLRGGLTLHALRRAVGDDTMREILQTYAARFADSNASTGDFIDLAEEIAGRDLAEVFDPWLYQTEVPPLP